MVEKYARENTSETSEISAIVALMLLELGLTIQERTNCCWESVCGRRAETIFKELKQQIDRFAIAGMARSAIEPMEPYEPIRKLKSVFGLGAIEYSDHLIVTDEDSDHVIAIGKQFHIRSLSL